MIDDEFQPTRIQMAALGILYETAMKKPAFPVQSERSIYDNLNHLVEEQRPHWFQELHESGLVSFLNDNHAKGLAESYWLNEDEGRTDGVSLTPAGIYYCTERFEEFAEQINGLTEDLDDEPIRLMGIVSDHFSANTSTAPAANRNVNFDDNSKHYQDAMDAINDLEAGLIGENDISVEQAVLKPKLLDELNKIRESIEKQSVSPSKLAIMGWGTLAFISAEFAERPVGKLADTAWQALQLLLGI